MADEMTVNALAWSAGSEGAERPPRLRMIPGLLALRRVAQDPPQAVRLFREQGPIVRIEVLHRRILLLLGPEANAFGNDTEYEFLTTTPLHAFAVDAGLWNSPFGQDGPAHRAARAARRRVFSRDHLAHGVDQLAAVVDETAEALVPGRRFSVRGVIQRLVAEQIGRTLLSTPGYGDRADDIVTFLNAISNVRIARVWPRMAYWLPSFRGARSRLRAWNQVAVAWHAANPPIDREGDLIDNLLESGRGTAAQLARDLVFPNSGIENLVAASCSLLYELHRHPDVLERVLAEVDLALAAGVLAEAGEHMPALQAALHETLRLHPPVPLVFRFAGKPFRFAGYRADAGDEVLIHSSATHFMEEFFPDPMRFDIERHLGAGTARYRREGVYNPFGLGPHACPGAARAILHVTLTTALLIRRLRFRLAAPDAPLRTELRPVLTPRADFQLEVLERRD
jgi:cytochrome P450